MPTVIPASITCLVISGCQVACLPISKKVAFRHSSVSALSTAGVLGQGPSSKVSTTSLSWRKSYCLKCWKPNWPAGGVDLDNPREAHATGALALWDGAGGRRGYVLNGSVGHRAIRAGRRRRLAFLLCPCRRSRAPAFRQHPPARIGCCAARAPQHFEIPARPAKRRSPEPEQLSFSQLRGTQTLC